MRSLRKEAHAYRLEEHRSPRKRYVRWRNPNPFQMRWSESSFILTCYARGRIRIRGNFSETYLMQLR